MIMQYVFGTNEHHESFKQILLFSSGIPLSDKATISAQPACTVNVVPPPDTVAVP